MLMSVKEDIYRYQGPLCSKLKVRLLYFLKPHTRYMWYFRHYHNSKVKCFWSLLLYVSKYRNGIQIPAQTKIGRGFRMLHFGNVVIHPDAVIGDNCNVAQGVLIGESYNHGKIGVPSIGDNCCLFANSIVIGGVSIGNNVLIAPGAFVNFDVPDNSIVIGNPGKILRREDSPTKKYIVYPV